MLVVKAGGRTITANASNIVRSVVRASSSKQVVLVHGGGDVVTEYCRALGIEPKFVVSPQGIRSRYTDEKELEVYVMVMAGKINKSLVAEATRHGARAVGISGADGGLLLAERKKRIVVVDERGRKRVIDGGYTGQIKAVNADLIRSLLSQGLIVVVAPIAVSEEGELLNVDGDQAAAYLARALGAEELVFLTDVDGLLIDGKLVGRLSADEAMKLLPSIGPGMNRKVMLAAESVKAGVGRAFICNGLGEDPLSLIESGIGTAVVP
ncbi:MAG: [LysW]-aminoadipate/[LysW]-glutamate kinase [Nitrososphaerota archaeon]